MRKKLRRKNVLKEIFFQMGWGCGMEFERFGGQ